MVSASVPSSGYTLTPPTQFAPATSQSGSSAIPGLSQLAISSSVLNSVSKLTESRSAVLSRFNLSPSKTSLSGIGASSIKRVTNLGLTTAETLGTNLLSSVASALTGNSELENQAAAARMGIELDDDALSRMETATIALQGVMPSFGKAVTSTISNLTSGTSAYNPLATGLMSFRTTAQNCGFSESTLSGFSSYFTQTPSLLTSSSPNDVLGNASKSDLNSYSAASDSLAMTNLKTQVSELTSRSIDYSTNTNLFNATFYDAVTKNVGSVVSGMSGSAYSTTKNGSVLTGILNKAIGTGGVSSQTISSAISAISGSKVSASSASMLSKVISGKTLAARDITAVGSIASSLGTSVVDHFRNKSDSVTNTIKGDTIHWNNGTTTQLADVPITWDDKTIESADKKLISTYAPELHGLYGGDAVLSEYF